MISDILPHFGKSQLEKKASDVVSAEDMDVFAGIAKEKEILEIFKKKYGVEKDDFLSAELEIVPAGKAREVGLDRSMIASYGHDDRVCAYAGLSALMDVAKKKTPPAKTSMVLLCDKEEIGSVGATGMESTFFENSVAELIALVNGSAQMLDVRRTLEASEMLSADVCAASDPHYEDSDSVGNAAKAGKGPCAIKYTGAASKGGASDARAEFIAKLRKLFDDEKIMWQMGELGYNYNKWCTSEGVDKTDSQEYETSRKPVKWDYYNNAERKKLYDVYCKLNKLRNDNPDLFGKGVDLNGTNHGGWPLKAVVLTKGSKKVYAYANYHGDRAASQNLTIPQGTWTDILTGKTVNGGSYVLHSGQALVLVNSAVVK
jgi:hypothetical protein